VTEQLDQSPAADDIASIAGPEAPPVGHTVDLPLRRADDFDLFVAEHAPELMRLAVMLTGDPDRAERLVRSTLARSYRRWRRIRRRDDPQAYVRRALVRHYVSWGAPHAGHDAATTPDLGPPFSGEVLTTSPADRAATWELLSRLSRRQRAVVVLHYYADMPLPMVADEMGSPEATVAAEAARALEALGTVVPLAPQEPT
jgi:RNA polymerase sigma-70 factor (sigma-E family)